MSLGNAGRSIAVAALSATLLVIIAVVAMCAATKLKQADAAASKRGYAPNLSGLNSDSVVFVVAEIQDVNILWEAGPVIALEALDLLNQVVATTLDEVSPSVQVTDIPVQDKRAWAFDSASEAGECVCCGLLCLKECDLGVGR